MKRQVPDDLIKRLINVDRRIENMEFLLRLKREERESIKNAIEAHLSREHLGTQEQPSRPCTAKSGDSGKSKAPDQKQSTA